MAYIGLKYAVFAPITTETKGQPITYGKGIVLGRMIQATINFTRNSDVLFADDVTAESDNSITGGTVNLNVDDIEEAAQVAALGVIKSGETGKEVYHETDTPAPYGGIGYLRVREKNKVKSYIPYWLHKTQLAVNSETANTKGNNIQWQTPTAEGQIMGVEIANDGITYFRDHKVFATESEAITWLNTMANITEA